MLQDVPGSDISKIYLDILHDESPDILAFPEYYFVGPEDDTVLASCFRRDSIIDRLAEISSDLGCILVGGTVVERVNGGFRNRSYILDSGEIIGFYDKIHPLDREGRGLIKPGMEYRVFDVRGMRLGILICADVLYPDTFRNIRGLSPELIFIPTTSPYRAGESDKEKFSRDERIFARGASRAAATIFKICASGYIVSHRLQARSLIASPGKIEWRNDPRFEDRSALIIARFTGDSVAGALDIKVRRA